MPGQDKYPNKFYGDVVESAANTLTFSEIQTNVNVFAKEAWILQRLEYYWPQATLALVVAAADVLEMALTSSNQITSLALSNPSVIDKFEMQYASYGAAASGRVVQWPQVRDFSGLPGGGIIIAPRPLFVAALGTSLTGPATVQCRGYFTNVTLKAEEYLELIDFYRIVQ